MKAKTVLAIVLAWSLLGVGFINAQGYPSPVAPPGEPSPAPAAEPRGHLSEWIVYRRPHGCCGPVGGDGPIHTELYLRTGASFPFGSGVYPDAVGVGWANQGGARVLLFDPDMTSPWFIDVGVSHIWNPQRRDVRIPYQATVTNIFGQQERANFGVGGVPGVTVEDLHRTFVNFGVGKYWYLYGQAGTCSEGWLTRWGVDIGGRWGRAHADLREVPHETDALSGVYVGIEANSEYPCGCCVFLAGIRCEYAHTWQEPLQANDADLSEINLMFTIGVRY